MVQKTPDAHPPTQPGPQDAQHVLIIQPGLIGDCILMLPLADALRRHNPATDVTLAARPDYTTYLLGRSVLSRVIDVDDLHLDALHAPPRLYCPDDNRTLGRHIEHYDRVISFSYRHDTAFAHNLETLARTHNRREPTHLTFTPPDHWKNHVHAWHLHQIAVNRRDPMHLEQQLPTIARIHPDPTDAARAYAAIRSNPPDPLDIDHVIAPGAGADWKRWPLANWRHLAIQLLAAGRRVLWLTGPAEDRTPYDRQPDKPIPHLKFLYCEDLQTLCGLAAVCTHYWGCDSGVSHLFAACGARCHIVYGPTRAEWYAPHGPHVATVQFDQTDFTLANETSLWELLKTYDRSSS
jgi:ADP-heptose:LPS heptosyltransferase